MEPGLAEHLTYILGSVPVGVAVLDSTNLRILYINPYLQAYLEEGRDVVGQPIAEVLPAEIYHAAVPLLQQVSSTGEAVRLEEVPFEGFLEVRGRTYWRITISCMPAGSRERLLITIEDVTEVARARLHLNAIHHISATIADASGVPRVLDRILQALQDMVGSRRCAVFLIDQPTGQDDQPAAWIAAQKDVHPISWDWRPQVDEHILAGRVARERSTLIITDTSTMPDVQLPYLDHQGQPERPGSVLCVPIFDPYTRDGREHPGAVLGSIEVYHVRARGFPSEEVRLLERFAGQAALALQNARLFRSIDYLARTSRRNARQKENIMQAIPDGIVIYDPRWRVADTNQAARALFGWSDDVIGMSITEAMERSTAHWQRPDYLRSDELAIAELERRALNGLDDQFKMVSAGGQTYTLRCTYTPIRDDLGDLFAFIAVYHDMTREAAARERIEAEVIARTAELAQRNQALQQAKEAQELAHVRMELLLSRLPSGVMLVDASDTAITLINQRAVRLLQSVGLPLEPFNDQDEAARRAIGLRCDELFRRLPLYNTAGKLVPYEEQPFYQALTNGEANEAELHTQGADGQILHFLFNAAPLRFADGSVGSVILVLHETTTYKALERAREDFFTTMAHELKTPLANIRAHLSALLAEDLRWSPEKQVDFLHTADEQVERLVGMINSFLDASRVEAGALRLQLEPLLLPELVEDLQDRLEALITASQRRLCVNVPADLPAVLGDYELIMSVLTNLLSNAFRYAPEGDQVYLDAEAVYGQSHQHPTRVTIRVTDHGPGISLEEGAALFTRFSTFAASHRPAANRPGQPLGDQRHNTARWSPGTGLGLYISRGIIEAHGSTLLFTSQPGEGTTFAFTLPVFDDSDVVSTGG
ncbi:MAG: PAS domain-containing protein [Ktedonobacteraceae bacterium]|nr:PAS domain-containing protein [Ktedonobacteraceae bacterium]